MRNCTLHTAACFLVARASLFLPILILLFTPIYFYSTPLRLDQSKSLISFRRKRREVSEMQLESVSLAPNPMVFPLRLSSHVVVLAGYRLKAWIIADNSDTQCLLFTSSTSRAWTCEVYYNLPFCIWKQIV